MINNNRYLPFAIVALVAGTLGWGVSTLTSKETTNAMTAPVVQPQPSTPQTLQPQQSFAPVTVPEATNALPVQQPAQVVYVKEAPAPVVRTVPVRASTATQPATVANEGANEDRREVLERTTTRKRGMSNKTKTAIAVGGAAGLGAAIGGIAGGGKGAGIGALIGAGSGAVYSVIRHKQNKPVF